MAYEGIKNYVMRQLGFPRVKVYLTPEQIEDAIWEAISYYFEYMSLKVKEHYINGTSGIGVYEIPPTIVPKFIREVIFRPGDPLHTMTGVAEDVYMLYYMQQASSSGSFLVDYWMTVANYEEYIRILGNQPHWEILDGNKLKLDPVPSMGFKIGIKYDEIPSENVIENVRWIKQYTLAQSKVIEGQIRSKFSSFQAGSGEVTLNGDALKAEGKEEITSLLEWLDKRQDPLGMVVG